MQAPLPPDRASTLVRHVVAGEGLLGKHRNLGVNEIHFKVFSADSSGLFVLENTFPTRGDQPAICIMRKTNGSTQWKATS